MRLFLPLSICCALVVCSCARPIAVKVSTTPVKGVTLTLNRPAPEVTLKAQPHKVGEPEQSDDSRLLTGVSDCVFEQVEQGRDLTIIAQKEGYEVTAVTIPAKAHPIDVSLLWSLRVWSSLLWSSTAPRAQYLIWEDENHHEVDLETEGITIKMTPIPSEERYQPTEMAPFDGSHIKGI